MADVSVFCGSRFATQTIKFKFKRGKNWMAEGETVKAMEGEAENGQSEMEVLTMQVLSNGLIWKTLGRCLNTSDLKCCRLVSKNFNRMVMDETDFRNRVVLKVKTEKLTPDEFGKTEEKWKKIALQFPSDKVSNPSNFTWLFPLLKEVNFLSLSLHKRKSVYHINFHPLLGELLLSTCETLKSLAMEPDFIRYGSGGIFHGNETLKNLQELEILEPNYRWLDFCGPVSDSEDSHHENEYRLATEFCEALKNVKIYKSYFVPIERNAEIGLADDVPFLHAAMELQFLWHVCKLVVKNNRKHIESHPFYDVYQSQPEALLNADVDAFRSEYFPTPALKSLQADASQVGTSIYNIANMYWPFLMYLVSRRTLDQIEISYPVDNPVSVILGAAVIIALCKVHQSLKTLKMRSDFLQIVQETCDWSPIRHSNLVELRLEDLREPKEGQEPGLDHSDWIPDVISSLPQSIRRIYLKGARGLKAKRKLKIQDFSQCNPNLVEELSILNAGGSLTNEVTQFICQNFNMLRKFNLSDCKTDDQGFLGISELKGLQFLTLKRCRISNKTLGKLAFKELRYLDVSDNPNVTLTGIKLAMRQCPSLETLIIPKLKDKFTKAIGQMLCPRLKYLIQ